MLIFFHYKKFVIDRHRRQGSSKVGIQDTLVFLICLICWGRCLLTLLSMGVSINFKIINSIIIHKVYDLSAHYYLYIPFLNTVYFFW